jgi:hypothetical protein
MKFTLIKEKLNIITALKRKKENIYNDVDVSNENVKIIDITNFLDQDFKYGKVPDIKNIENFYSNYKNLIEINSSMNFKLADEFHDIFKIISVHPLIEKFESINCYTYSSKRNFL